MLRDIDQLIAQVRRDYPDVAVEQLQIAHPGADDDGLWFFRHPSTSNEVQVESSTGAAPFLVTYELTSGGTALVEKLAPGTPMEMITVYANQGSQVNVTHFCMMGNQPELRLKKAEGDVFQFEMDGTHGISDKNDMHMHALTLTLHGDQLKHEWTNYKDDKKGEVMVFEFTKQH